jgi:hypothetical protein
MSVFQHFEEAKRHVDRVHEENNSCQEKRLEVLERLQQAYENKDKPLKKHVEIFEARCKARRDAYANVFDPVLNNILAYIDTKCGYPQHDA